VPYIQPTIVSAAASGGSSELFYAEITTTLDATSTSEASPDNLVSLGAQTYAAVPIYLEFFCAAVTGAGVATIACLWDANTELFRWGDHRGEFDEGQAMFCKTKLTPTAGSHTYRVRVFGSGVTHWNAGSVSGGSGTYPPIYLRADLA